jgi:hypothetical protein
MPKERMNVTVDPEVKKGVKARGDINVSGAVNEYLKRRLAGKDESDAMLELKIQRHEDQAEDHEEEARKHRQKAEVLRQKLKERKEQRRTELKEAIEQLRVEELQSAGAYVKTEDEKVESLAEGVGVDPAELRQLAIEEYQEAHA